jgi:hypothetical protein
MLEIIINTIFSIPYLVLGVLVAALLDTVIYYTRVTNRFTLIEIWGCTMFWPLVLLVVAFFSIRGFK